MIYETRFLWALVVTTVMEVPVVLLFVKGIFREKKVTWKRLVLFALLASALTLPYLWFVLGPYVDRRLYVYYGEFLVFVAEGILFWVGLDLKWYKAFIISLVANVWSWLVGVEVLRWVIEVMR